MQEFLRISERYYPETLATHYFINAPSVFTLLWCAAYAVHNMSNLLWCAAQCIACPRMQTLCP